MGATSHDVARAAGVSQSTVSRALRGEAGMSEQTRERIRAVAAELSYVPSEIGRSLSTRATRRIGVVAADLTNPFFPELVEPLREDLDRNGYRTLLITDQEQNPVEIGRLADGSLDGVVLTTTLLGSSLPEELSTRGIPYVIVNRDVDDIDADTCVVDNRRGALEVAEYLAGLGHCRIAAIFGPADTSTGRDREAGFRDGLARSRVGLPGTFVRRGVFAHATGRRATLELLALPQPPTAVFCGNDVIAMGACSAAIAAGLRVPADLSIVGFDDIPMSAWDVIDLTTVHTGIQTMAHIAVSFLLRRIKEPSTPVQRVVLRPRLVLRGTHGSPASPRQARAGARQGTVNPR
jgi:LacI family transcriptional regulator, galactose operon repressor